MNPPFPRKRQLPQPRCGSSKKRPVELGAAPQTGQAHRGASHQRRGADPRLHLDANYTRHIENIIYIYIYIGNVY